MQKIAAQNGAYAAGRSGWWATTNEFTDWTDEEFRRMLGARRAGLGEASAAARALVPRTPHRAPHP